jgi:hypothetical protein
MDDDFDVEVNGFDSTEFVCVRAAVVMRAELQ